MVSDADFDEEALAAREDGRGAEALSLLRDAYAQARDNPDVALAYWDVAAIVMVAFTFLAVFLYDALFKSPLGKTNKVGGSIGRRLVHRLGLPRRHAL